MIVIPLHQSPVASWVAIGPGHELAIAQPKPKITLPTTCRRSGRATVQATGSRVTSVRARTARRASEPARPLTTATANISYR
jgi:hypothetical protein